MQVRYQSWNLQNNQMCNICKTFADSSTTPVHLKLQPSFHELQQDLPFLLSSRKIHQEVKKNKNKYIISQNQHGHMIEQVKTSHNFDAIQTKWILQPWKRNHFSLGQYFLL